MAKQVDVPTNLEGLITVLEVESARMQKSARIGKQIMVSFVVVMMLVFGIIWAKTKRFPSDFSSQFGIFGCLGSAGVAASAKHRRALKLAAGFEDPRVVPFLIEATGVQQSSVAKLARETLTYRLPKIQDPSDLDTRSRQLLSSSLMQMGADTQYLRVAIEALGRVGSKESIPGLESFMRRPGFRRKAEFEKLKIRAHQSLGEARIRGARELIQAKEQETSELLKSALTSISPVESAPVKAESHARA